MLFAQLSYAKISFPKESGPMRQVWIGVVALASVAQAQRMKPFEGSPLDPSRTVTKPAMESATHTPLKEEYIWAAGEPILRNGAYYRELRVNEDADPRFFRRNFDLGSVPKVATLYVAGPRSVVIYINGDKVMQSAPASESRRKIHTYTVDVASHLKHGKNVIAIEAVRSSGSPAQITSDLMYEQVNGRILAVKIVPAAEMIDAPPIVWSDATWKVSTSRVDGWEKPAFDDVSWSPVRSLGGMESSVEFFQWNVDNGLYAWPGYDGISPYLAQMSVKPAEYTHVIAGDGAIQTATDGTLTLSLPGGKLDDDHAPQVLIDFGREVNGRIRFVSKSGAAVKATVAYGEDPVEAMTDPFLGVMPMLVPAGKTVYGPKSAFRYAMVKFVAGAGSVTLQTDLAAIYYPVEYKGWFESSDKRLNRLWEIGAYTAHLCMQDDIWDAPKRDRGRWMGDLEVMGRTIEDSFGPNGLMDGTMDHLIGPSPVVQHVNTIPGYSAYWVMGEAEYYRHGGDRKQLDSVHQRMVELMHTMEKELDAGHLYANNTHAWTFVDWSPELNGDTPETRRATQMEFFAAFREGAWLLHELGDDAEAAHFDALVKEMREAAKMHLADALTGSYGSRYQTNAMAVVSGVADPKEYDAIWRGSLVNVGQAKFDPMLITPYYGYYVATGMAGTGHRQQALDWVRMFWGGMMDEGATSFWEGYDPWWYKGEQFHASLQADNNSGNFVSLAHGWSSGVTPWLMEQVLGIHSTGAGFRTVSIRPDVLDMQYVKGGEPTPRGMLTVSATPGGVEIDLPPGTVAEVSLPHRATVDGAKQEPGKTDAVDGRPVYAVSAAGHHVFRYE